MSNKWISRLCIFNVLVAIAVMYVIILQEMCLALPPSGVWSGESSLQAAWLVPYIQYLVDNPGSNMLLIISMVVFGGVSTAVALTGMGYFTDEKFNSEECQKVQE